jgi:hypothetical protein
LPRTWLREAVADRTPDAVHLAGASLRDQT